MIHCFLAIRDMPYPLARQTYIFVVIFILHSSFTIPSYSFPSFLDFFTNFLSKLSTSFFTIVHIILASFTSRSLNKLAALSYDLLTGERQVKSVFFCFSWASRKILHVHESSRFNESRRSGQGSSAVADYALCAQPCSNCPWHGSSPPPHAREAKRFAQ